MCGSRALTPLPFGSFFLRCGASFNERVRSRDRFRSGDSGDVCEAARGDRGCMNFAEVQPAEAGEHFKPQGEAVRVLGTSVPGTASDEVACAAKFVAMRESWPWLTLIVAGAAIAFRQASR